MAGLLTGLLLTAGLPARAADLGSDCSAKAAMGMPCGDIDNTQIVTQKNDQGVASENKVKLQPSTQLNIPGNAIPTIKGSDGAVGRDSGTFSGGGLVAVGHGPSQFQVEVSAAAGSSLPIFGEELFAAPAMFSASLNLPVTSDYAIGPGDEVIIRAWGQVDIDYRGVVDRNGILGIPKVGNINVAGVKYDHLQTLIKASISRIYTNFDLTVTMGQLRSFQVFVVGQAKRPGAYTLGPLSTLVNAVYLSGGPSTSGSLRKIELKRAGKVVAEFDFYDLLLKGDKTKDIRLEAGDVIYIAPVGAQVAITGSVNAPAIFEAKEGESLAHLITWAGGLSNTAQTKKISIQRNLDGQARQVQEVELSKDGLRTLLKSGDIAFVSAISPQIKNAVTLRGNIAEAKHFPWREGLRVRDLIPERDALITKDYWLGKNGMVHSGKGEQQALKRTLSEINWDYAVVERLERGTLTTTLIPFDLGKAIIAGDPENNLVLEPGDVITVFSKDDMGVPVEKRSVYVRLTGEFVHPGLYKVKQGETLRDVIERLGGGVTGNAYVFATSLSRESLRIEQQQAMDAAIKKAEAQLLLSATYATKKAIDGEDVAQTKANMQQQLEYLGRLKQIRATGRLVLNIAENAAVQDIPEVVLQDGDVVGMPIRESTVNVVGEVVAQNSFLYQTSVKLGDYVAYAGGVTDNGDKDALYVVHVNGMTDSIKPGPFGWRFGTLEGRTMLPGDSIVVPQLPEKTAYMKNVKDITQIFAQFGLGAAAIRVLTK